MTDNNAHARAILDGTAPPEELLANRPI